MSTVRYRRHYISTAAVAATAPFIILPFILAPALAYQPLDTTHGTPLTLSATTGTKPFFNPPFFSPQQHGVNEWQPADTSHRAAPVLGGGVKPVFVAPFFGPDQHTPNEWLNPDTSHGIPKPLLPEVKLPIGQAVYPTPDAARPVYDTSRGTTAPLFPVVAQIPPAQPSFVELPRSLWQPEDTSSGTPKPNIADSVQPFFVLQQTLLDPIRSVYDTSRGTTAPLFPTVVAPPPVQPSFVELPKQWWQPLDSSASTPKVVYGDQIQPRINLPQYQVQPWAQVINTAQGTPPTLFPILPLPPGQASFVGTPYTIQVLPDTSQIAWANYIPPFVPPPPVIVTVGGGWRPEWMDVPPYPKRKGKERDDYGERISDFDQLALVFKRNQIQRQRDQEALEALLFMMGHFDED